jgi:hypothetical protein
MPDIVGLFLAGASMSQVSIVFGFISLFFGLLILWKPNIISYLIAIYLILIGIGAILGSMI